LYGTKCHGFDTGVQQIRTNITNDAIYKFMAGNPLKHKPGTLRADLAKAKLLFQAASKHRVSVAVLVLTPLSRLATLNKSLQESTTPLTYKHILECILTLFKAGVFDQLPATYKAQWSQAWRFMYSQARRQYDAATREAGSDPVALLRQLFKGMKALPPGHPDRLLLALLLRTADLSPKLLSLLPDCVIERVDNAELVDSWDRSCVLLLSRDPSKLSYLGFRRPDGALQRRQLTGDVVNQVEESLISDERKLLVSSTYRSMASLRKHVTDVLKRLGSQMTYKQLGDIAESADAKVELDSLLDVADELEAADEEMTPAIM
jgi:hypothetical protein